MLEAKPTGSVRERLLAAADALFYEEGVHVVGIDRILERAGVAKASLYGTFGSKEELVRAYLEHRSKDIQTRTTERIARHDEAREKMVAIFDFLRERIVDGSYRGCPFLRAWAELPPGPNAARNAAVTHRLWRRALFARLATDLGVRDPAEMSRQLSVLYDGAMIAASIDGDPEAAITAGALAARLIDDSQVSSKKRPPKVTATRAPARRSKAS